ncbi:MAG: class II aldolase/adducin family protein [Rhodobacteraceae bacterium]|jgi:ribulose-5-phosphate 4-epimerase/fuculose-1-phosphate aldolase|nr:class II aldolase and adducin N-terminal domain-containing protein [uncultured Defluviimonas sp.]MCC0070513.1 class II aldolase/adducin family protein [Paracoccaceae bacterium]
MTEATRANITHIEERRDLSAAFRWTAREGMHEGVANHFSLAVNDDGTRFLINPFGRHFARMRASDLLLLDANDPATLDRPDAPDPTAWGLHGAIHRACPHARCVMHVHSIHATVLACLADSRLPAVDQNSAMFHGRHVVDASYGGMAFEEEGARCAALLRNPKVRTMIMGNHGVLVIGETVAETFNRLYYFERAAETYVRALQTGQPLRVLSDEIAEKTAQEWEAYPDLAGRFLSEIRAMLDAEGADYTD